MFKQVRDDIKGNRMKPLYILTGPERTVMSTYLEMIENKATVKSLTNVVQMSQSGSLFGNRHMSYIIRDDKEALGLNANEIIEALGKNKTVFLIYEDIDKRKTLFRTGKEFIYEFTTIKNSDVYIRQKLGNRVTADQAKLIAKRCNNDIGKINLEIEKLLYLDDEEISTEMINKLIVPSAEDQIWDFLKNIIIGNAKEAYEQYKDLKIVGSNEVQFALLLYTELKIIMFIKTYPTQDNNWIAEQTHEQWWRFKNMRPISNHPVVKETPIEVIIETLHELQELDRNIKLGKVDGDIGFKTVVNNYLTKIN